MDYEGVDGAYFVCDLVGIVLAGCGIGAAAVADRVAAVDTVSDPGDAGRGAVVAGKGDSAAAGAAAARARAPRGGDGEARRAGGTARAAAR